MRGLLNKVEKIVKFRILNPFPADARPELMKKSQTPVLTVKWSGQNDIKLFRNWVHSWLAWMSSNRWKGIGFNELHVHKLTITLKGNVLDLAMHHVQNDICNDHKTKFWDL